MSDFVIKTDVPVLDEHTLLDDEGQPLMEIDERRLQDIARRANARIRDTGDLVPIVVGHTKDGLPEQSQPEIVGYAGPFKVIPFFKTGKKALAAAKWRVFRSKVGVANQFPRRSVELWLSDLKIDPISLLGATTPERDLGLLRLSREGKRVYQRVIPSESEAKPVDHVKEIVDAVLAALKESDVWKWAEDQMAQGKYPEEGEDEALGLDDLGGDEDMPLDMGGEDDLADLTPEEDDLDEDEPAKEKPVKMAAGGPSVAGGSNTYIPSGIDRDRRRMQRDQGRTAKHRYQRALEETQAQLAGLRLQLQRSNRERDLVQLESEGVVLDRTEELDAVQDMPEPQYRKYLGRVRKRYSKAPIGSPAWSDALGRNEPQGGLTKAQALEIADYAAKTGKTYDQARAELMGRE